jgi:hypothetical protein
MSVKPQTVRLAQRCCPHCHLLTRADFKAMSSLPQTSQGIVAGAALAKQQTCRGTEFPGWTAAVSPTGSM